MSNEHDLSPGESPAPTTTENGDGAPPDSPAADTPPPTDWADLAGPGYQRMLDDGWDPQHPTLLPRRGRLPRLSPSELIALPPPTYLVDGVLEQNSMAMIAGPPGHFKTFMAFDLACSVATERPWHGRRIIPVTDDLTGEAGGVLYIAGEGVNGLGKRLRAWQAHTGVTVPDDRLAIISKPLNLFNPDDDGLLELTGGLVADPGPAPYGKSKEEWEQWQLRGIEAKEAAQGLLNGMQLSLIVIDTLAVNATGAEENSSRDMGRVLAAADKLRELTGATVLLIHHTNKAGNGYRGSSAIGGFLTTHLELESGILTCRKQRNGEPFAPAHFLLQGVPETGSAVLVPGAAPMSGEKLTKAALLQYVIENPGSNLRTIREALSGSNQAVAQQLRQLKAEGLVREELGPRSSKLYFPVLGGEDE